MLLLTTVSERGTRGAQCDAGTRRRPLAGAGHFERKTCGSAAAGLTGLAMGNLRVMESRIPVGIASAAPEPAGVLRWAFAGKFGASAALLPCPTPGEWPCRMLFTPLKVGKVELLRPNSVRSTACPSVARAKDICNGLVRNDMRVSSSNGLVHTQIYSIVSNGSVADRSVLVTVWSQFAGNSTIAPIGPAAPTGTGPRRADWWIPVPEGIRSPLEAVS